MTPSLNSRGDHKGQNERDDLKDQKSLEDWAGEAGQHCHEDTLTKRSGRDDLVRHLEGGWHNDYSPRYQKPYDIYKKAVSHIRDIKRNTEK